MVVIVMAMPMIMMIRMMIIEHRVSVHCYFILIGFHYLSSKSTTTFKSLTTRVYLLHYWRLK